MYDRLVSSGSCFHYDTEHQTKINGTIKWKDDFIDSRWTFQQARVQEFKFERSPIAASTNPFQRCLSFGAPLSSDSPGILLPTFSSHLSLLMTQDSATKLIDLEYKRLIGHVRTILEKWNFVIERHGKIRHTSLLFTNVPKENDSVYREISTCLSRIRTTNKTTHTHVYASLC